MNLFNIPGLNGYKTLISGWGLFIIGVAGMLVDLANLLALVGQCLQGQVDIIACAQQIPQLTLTVGTAFLGLGILGIGHKIQKATAAQASAPAATGV